MDHPEDHSLFGRLDFQGFLISNKSTNLDKEWSCTFLLFDKAQNVPLSPLHRKFTEKGFRVWETFFPCVSFSMVIRLAMTSCQVKIETCRQNLYFVFSKIQLNARVFSHSPHHQCLAWIWVAKQTTKKLTLNACCMVRNVTETSISSHPHTSTQPTQSFFESLMALPAATSTNCHILKAGCVKETHDETSLLKAQKPLWTSQTFRILKLHEVYTSQFCQVHHNSYSSFWNRIFQSSFRHEASTLTWS